MSPRKRPSLIKRALTRLAHFFGGAHPDEYTKHWTSQDGRQTMICHLDDSHLCNILRLLQRNHFRLSVAAARPLGPPPSGEMARMAWEKEMEEIWDIPAVPQHPLYTALRHEAEWRGLTW